MAIGQGVIRGPPGHAPAVLADVLARHPRGQGPAAARRRPPCSSTSFARPARGNEPTVLQDYKTEGLFTVEYPDERLPVYERFRVLPVLIYDTEDGNVRCTSCNICAKVCPPQCIWMTQAKSPKGTVVPLPEDFYIDMDVCMNCGLCSEYCPFDAIKMDQNFELSNYERHQTHIYSLQDLLVSSEFYARTHPEAWSSAEEVAERNKVAKKKDQRLQKALVSQQGRAGRGKAAPSTGQGLIDHRPSRARPPRGGRAARREFTSQAESSRLRRRVLAPLDSARRQHASMAAYDSVASVVKSRDNG